MQDQQVMTRRARPQFQSPIHKTLDATGQVYRRHTGQPLSPDPSHALGILSFANSAGDRIRNDRRTSSSWLSGVSDSLNTLNFTGCRDGLGPPSGREPR